MTPRQHGRQSDPCRPGKVKRRQASVSAGLCLLRSLGREEGLGAVEFHLAGGDARDRELAGGIGAGVDGDAAIGDIGLVDDGVAMDHPLPVAARFRQEIGMAPGECAVFLLVERFGGVGAGMHHSDIAGLVHQRQHAQPVDQLGSHGAAECVGGDLEVDAGGRLADAGHAEAGQGLQPAVADPAGALVLRRVEEGQQHVFVIAAQAEDVGAGDQAAQHLGAVVAAVDVVADADDRQVGGQVAQHLVEQVDAAMDVAHGMKPRFGGDRGEGHRWRRPERRQKGLQFHF